VDIRLHQLESQLNDFDAHRRAAALADLVALAEEAHLPVTAPSDVANMHCHTFFSYNAEGYSPSALAWQAWKRGVPLMGIVDFDVLDGVDEFLDACGLLGIRASAGMETRVFLPEYFDSEITSPGEPGITYHMGIGFSSSTVPSAALPLLQDLSERGRQRNLSVLRRVNDHLDPVSIDYERDVLPLTPAGNATERHMVVAYIEKAKDTVSDQVAFWASKLHLTQDQVASVMLSAPGFQSTIRKKLMKRGGVGYVQPGPDSFPSLEQVHELIVASGALPCATWLDGTSDGEQHMEELLHLLMEKGVVALNIVPDRNWNIADPELRQLKVRNLHRVVVLAQELDLPLNAGTEMNAQGQRFVDDFSAPEMEPVRQAFLDGAYFIYGHTAMQRSFGLGYQSDWISQRLPTRRERVDFYIQAGQLLEPSANSNTVSSTLGAFLELGNLLGLNEDDPSSDSQDALN